MTDTEPPSETASSVRVTLAAALATTYIHLPIFMVGGLAVLIREDIPAIDEATIGLTVSAFFATTAVSSVLGGRFSDARGPRAGLLASAGLTAIVLVGTGLAQTLVWLLIACALSGVANGIGQTAANLSIARGVRVPRQGIALGIKQSAVQIAGLLAGLSIPVLGVTLGWRPTFVIVSVIGIGVTAWVPRDRSVRRRRGSTPATPSPAKGPLRMLAAAAGFGAAAANALPAFVVLTAVGAGVATGPAGLLLALGSGSGVVSRLVVGWLADRHGRASLPVVGGMMLTGACGYLMLAAGDVHVGMLVAGTMLGFAAGWGWPGLILLATIQLDPSAPGRSTGAILAGVSVGGVLGPATVGIVARSASMALGWSVSTVLALCAAACVFVAHRLARRVVDAAAG